MCVCVRGPSIILVVVAVPLCCVENCYAAHKAECDKMNIKKTILILIFVYINIIYGTVNLHD